MSTGGEVKPSWPVIDGAFVVGNPDAPVAVCALNSEKLVEPLAKVEGVAIAGKVFTANLGIERIVTNVTANPAIRFLLLCGKDSKLFRPGQSLGALLDNGVDDQRRIIGAEGHDPVIPTVSPARVDTFRRRVELVDWIGEEDIETINGHITSLVARGKGRFSGGPEEADLAAEEAPESASFISISPGGQKQPLQYDPKGYFVITLDRDEDQIVLRHYLPDHTPAHEMRGRVATSMLLGLMREGLISQLSHAGYLGEELAKAEAALRLDLRYDQDRPLRRPPQEPAAAGAADQTSTPLPAMPRIQPSLTLERFLAASEGEEVGVALAVTEQIGEMEFRGIFLEPIESDPFSSFHRTSHQLAMSASADTKTAMGTLADVALGAIVRIRGMLGPGGNVDARSMAIITGVANVRDAEEASALPSQEPG